MNPTTNQKIAQTSTPTTTTNKNPLSFNKIEDRGKAISEKLDRIKANPNYQKLSEQDQKKVISGVYHKYVVPAYKGAGYEIPRHDAWITGAHSIDRIGNRSITDTFNDKDGKAFAEDMIVGGVRALDKIDMFGIKLNRKAYMLMHGLENHFAAPIANKLGYQVSNKPYSTEIANEKHAQKVVQNIQSADYYLDSHPRKGFINSLGSDTGEFLVQLPIYEAVGAGRGLVGLAGKATFDSLPLTQKLSLSPVGKFVAKRIGYATDGFVSALATNGGDKKGAVNDAIGFYALGEASEAIGKVIKVASVPLIKKWTANTIAMGGKPLAQEVTDSVINQEIGHDLALSHKEIKPLDLGQNISIHPESEEKGKFIFNDPVDNKAKEFHYTSVKDRQQVYNNLQHIAQTVRSKYDPLVYKMEQGEQAALNSMSMEKYNAPFSRLNHEQRIEIGKMRYDSIEQAAQEAPVHLPELTHAEHEDSIATQAKQNPEFAQNAKLLEKMGIKLADVTAENEIEKTAINTGIKDSIATQAKVGKSRNSAISTLEKKRMEKGISINAVSFNKNLANSIAYFKMPRNRIKLDAAVGPKATQNFKDFYELLKDADGNQIHFENPYHRMLFHFGNRANLPDNVADRIAYELRKITPGKSAADIGKEADWFHVHLLQMARSGRLVKEGNIFNSTKTAVSSMRGWTPWQKQLTTEVDKEQYNLLKKQLKRHPEVMKGVDAFVQAQSKIRLNAKTAEEWIEADRKLHETLIKTGAMVSSDTILR